MPENIIRELLKHYLSFSTPQARKEIVIRHGNLWWHVCEKINNNFQPMKLTNWSWRHSITTITSDEVGTLLKFNSTYSSTT